LQYEQRFRVITSNAVISVRGTEFVVEYNESTGSTEVYLYNGTLEITSGPDNTFSLDAGNLLTISKDGTTAIRHLESMEWAALKEEFAYADSDYALKTYAWATFTVLVISAILAMVLMKRAKKKPLQKKGKKDLGRLSILLGILGIAAALLPIIGYPLSVASRTIAFIQKMRKPTRLAKIGFILGYIGVVLNAVSCFFLMMRIML